MSGWSVNPTTLFLGRLRPPKRLTSIKWPYFAYDWQLPLTQWKGANNRRKDFMIRESICRTRYRIGYLWLFSQTRHRLRYAARLPVCLPAQRSLLKIYLFQSHWQHFLPSGKRKWSQRLFKEWIYPQKYIGLLKRSMSFPTPTPNNKEEIEEDGGFTPSYPTALRTTKTVQSFGLSECNN